MAQVESKSGKLHFDPYTEDPDSHFHQVLRNLFNDGRKPTYRQFKQHAEDKSSSAATLKQFKELKKSLESSLEGIYEERGVGSLQSILSFTERLSLHDSLSDRKDKKRSTKKQFDVPEGYLSGDKEAVEQTISEILGYLPYPTESAFDELKQIFSGGLEVTFKPESNVLIIDREIPPPEDIPRRKKIKYIKSRDVYEGKDLNKRDFENLYESIPYQIAIRTAYEAFVIDQSQEEVVDSVVFNGWVTSVNPATGHEETVCTLSLQASEEEIMSLNLSRVDPKACFKNLKGVSASSLREKSPITPIVEANREDDRFTEGRDVGEDMEEGENIAAMDWEDFEHLIRELFESEFAEEGGEVNVTQASRDGGIDAVAFDPDPLRGGKIVIQAKRYTQTVGVSAVRDLYGTVMNEGASKGILVTTSDYGSGAYDFAKDKPIQLLDGGNLLSMLEQHGYDARIDVDEAREKMD